MLLASGLANLFLEDPTPLLLGLGLIALVLWILARRHGDRRLWRGALIAASAGVLIFLLAYFVETTREQLMARTRAAVQATAPLDMAQLRQLVAPQAQLVGPHGNVWLAPGQMLDAMDRMIQRVQTGSHDILDINARQDSPHEAISGVKVRTRAQAAGGLPLDSHWELRWEKDRDGQWRIVQVQFLEFEGRKPTFSLLN